MDLNSMLNSDSAPTRTELKRRSTESQVDYRQRQTSRDPAANSPVHPPSDFRSPVIQSPYHSSPSSAVHDRGYPFPPPGPSTPQAQHPPLPQHSPYQPQYSSGPPIQYSPHQQQNEFSPRRESYPPAHNNPRTLSASPIQTPNPGLPPYQRQNSAHHAQPPLQRTATMPMDPPSYHPHQSPNLSRPPIHQPSPSPSISSRTGYFPLDQSPIVENDRVQSLSREQERERTASISPKTATTGVSHQNSLGSRNEMEGVIHTNIPSRSGSQSEPTDRMSTEREGSARIESIKPERPKVSPLATEVVRRDSVLQSPMIKKESILQSPMVNRNSISTPTAAPPPRKRRRFEEPPIYARVVPERANVRVEGRPGPFRGSSLKAQMSANGHGLENGIHKEASPRVESPFAKLEPSITNVQPIEDLTKRIADFLFQEVVNRGDVGNEPGVMIEIEAKVGTIIDKHTNERIRLPVVSECLLSDDPSLRMTFQSQMTQEQHKQLNDFLNTALISSRAPPGKQDSSGKKRVPIDYVHTHERDTFYDLPDSAAVYATLPPSVRSQIDPRRSKVRITTEKSTGEVLAKIIKMRLSNLHIYSPRTVFDWRVSVSLEMNYHGEIEALNAGRVSSASDIARNKDRLSYKHQAYQIDLTQVTPHEGKGDKVHELEVEVSSAELRRHGSLLLAGKPNQYEEVVRGFVDNVRVLTRVINPFAQ